MGVVVIKGQKMADKSQIVASYGLAAIKLALLAVTVGFK